jgi:erythronate-4-phosphate dehydrogenase
MRIVADENIPFVREAFGDLGAVVRLPGWRLDADRVREADVLLVRSVTPVTPALLEGSRVRFVGSATIGTDHVDEAYLQARGIAFAHAPGSNAGSVVEYVLAALLHLAVRQGVRLPGKTVGIVGCGHIGGRLAERLPALGLRVLPNDPPRAEAAEARGRPHPYVPLGRLLAEADVVTLHVPLTRAGPHPTRHLFDAAVLGRMKPDAWLLNTSRGAVVSGEALKTLRAAGRPGAVVLDVWEHEPEPDPALLRRVALATPHIAGYSFDGKVQGTLMLYRALLAHLGRPAGWDAEAVLASTPEDRPGLLAPDPFLPVTDWLHRLVRQMYDLAADDLRMRRLPELSPAQQAAYFNELRKAYPRRRAFERHHLPAHHVPQAYREAVAQGLGVPLLTSTS